MDDTDRRLVRDILALVALGVAILTAISLVIIAIT